MYTAALCRSARFPNILTFLLQLLILGVRGLTDAGTKLYCVYLLLSENEKYKGKVYIGFTVDPNRRLKQHNAGVSHGGAFKTNNKGPWEMILVVHGFPHEVSALRFEWAWQNPHLSRRLKHIKKKRPVESLLKFHLRVLDGMLQIGPWKRIPLHVQWLKACRMSDIESSSHLHHVSYANEENSRKVSMKNVFSIHKQTSTAQLQPYSGLCFSCGKHNDNSKFLLCLNSSCKGGFHVNCLAKYFLKDEDEIIPLNGHCPLCSDEILWCHIISVNRLLL